MKFVYLIQSQEDGYYKIGVSKHPKKRMSQLQTGNSSELKLIKTFESEFANVVEKTMHRRYRTSQKEGEWFDLSISDEESFINECEKIENNLKLLHENKALFL